MLSVQLKKTMKESRARKSRGSKHEGKLRENEKIKGKMQNRRRGRKKELHENKDRYIENKFVIFAFC